MRETQKREWVKFGQHLRRLRRQHGLTLESLAKQAHCSSTYLSKIEQATRTPNKDVTDALDAILRTNGSLLRERAEIVRAEATPGWYEQAREFEKQATEIRFFHPFVLPGHVQTRGYTEAIMRDSSPGSTAAVIDRHVSTKETWSKELADQTDLNLSVVIPETVIRQAVGSTEEHRDQLSRLLDEANQERTTMQVLPKETPNYAWSAGPFRLIYVPQRPTILCAEHCSGEVVVDDPEEVARLEAVFGKLQTWALSPVASSEALEQMRAEL